MRYLYMYIKKMDIDFQTHTPLSILPSAECLSGGAEHTRAPAPCGSGPEKSAPRRPARLRGCPDGGLRNRVPTRTVSCISPWPGLLPAGRSACSISDMHLGSVASPPAPGLSFHPTKNYKPQGLKTKSLDSRSEISSSFVLS